MTHDPLSACCGDPGDCSQAGLYCFNRTPKEANVGAMNEITARANAQTAFARTAQENINAVTQGSLPLAAESEPAYRARMGFDDDAHAKDDIKRPGHYAQFPIEPCTFIMLNELPFWTGNVIKYVVRAPHKHSDERIDIRKAIRYCEMRIEELDRVAAGTDGDVIGNPL